MVPGHVTEWLEQCVTTCTPRDVHIMDGTPQEARELKVMLVRSHVMIPLPKYDNCYLVRTDPRDVARSEGRTFLSTKERIQSVPTPEDVKSQLGNWIHPDQLQVQDITKSSVIILNGLNLRMRFPNCSPDV